MAEENGENQQPKSKSGKGLMIALIAVVIILILAVAGGGYYLFSKGVFSDNQQMNPEEAAKEEVVQKGSFKTNIDDLVLNITNAKGREKLMKLSFTVKSTEPTIEAMVEENKPEIIDVVIAQISARNSEELLTVGGKALLKEELIEQINIVLNEFIESNEDSEDFQKDNIKKLFFTTFVIK